MLVHNRIAHLTERIVYLMELINVKRLKLVVQYIQVFLNRDVRMQKIKMGKDVGMIQIANVEKEHVQKNW